MKRADTYHKLMKIVKFLQALPEDKFDFNQYVAEEKDGCGTVCCAAGWTPAIFPELKDAWLGGTAIYLDYYRVQKFLDLNNVEWIRLFVPGYSQFGLSGLGGRITAKRVARHIERCACDMARGVDITSDEYGRFVRDAQGEY